MCLALIAFAAHPRYRLIVAANRGHFPLHPPVQPDAADDDVVGMRVVNCHPAAGLVQAGQVLVGFFARQGHLARPQRLPLIDHAHRFAVLDHQQQLGVLAAGQVLRRAGLGRPMMREIETALGIATASAGEPVATRARRGGKR